VKEYEMNNGTTVEGVGLASLIIVAHAIAEFACLEVSYVAKNGEYTDRFVEPHILYSGVDPDTCDDDWYLKAWDIQKGAWRTFKLKQGQFRRTNVPFLARGEISVPQDLLSGVKLTYEIAVGESAPSTLHVAPFDPSKGTLPQQMEHIFSGVTV